MNARQVRNSLAVTLTFVIGAINMVHAEVNPPEGYTRIDYIESTGAQYIDTGVIGQPGMHAKLDFALTKEPQTSLLIGCYGNNMRYYIVRNVYNNGTQLGYLINKTKDDMEAGDTYPVTVGKDARHVIEFDYTFERRTFTLDGEAHVTADTLNPSSAVSSGKTLYLFTYNNGNNPAGTAGSYACMRLYGAEVTDGTNSRVFVPYLDANKRPCLWDTVEGKPYYNLGAGEFDIPPGEGGLPVGYTLLDYVWSSGTQYVDLDMTGRAGLKTKLDLAVAEGIADGGSMLGCVGNSYRCYVLRFLGNAQIDYVFNKTKTSSDTERTVANMTYGFGFRHLIEFSLDLDKRLFIVDGVTNETAAAIGAFETGVNLYMFNYNTSGGPNPTSYVKARLYGADVDNGVVHRVLVPCRDRKGRVCLYDTQNSRTFYSETAEDLLGPDDLPAGYVKLDYIQSTGDQYIDTGIIGKAGMFAELDFALEDRNGTLLGSYGNGMRGYFAIWSGTDYGYLINTGANNVEQQKMPMQVGYDIRHKYSLDFQTDRRVLTIDGVSLTNTATATAWTSNQSMALFNYLNGGNPNATAYSKARLYGADIDNGLSHGVFVPCRRRSDGVLGLYDIYRFQFRHRESGSEFLASDSEVIPLTATWTGAGEAGRLDDPDNWTCVNAFGNEIGGLPSYMTVVTMPAEILALCTNGAPLSCKSISLPAALTADCDWSEVAFLDKVAAGMIDLAGHRLTLTRLGNAMTAMSSVAGGEVWMKAVPGVDVNLGGKLTVSGAARYVLDLSGLPGAMDGTAAAYIPKYADGAVPKVVVMLGERRIRSGDLVIAWTEQPTGISFGEVSSAKFSFQAKEDGLFAYRGMMVIIK